MGGAWSPNLFGREHELAVARAMLESVPGGPALLGIEGEAGIGKTSVWRATVDVARTRSWRVLAARPSESEAQLSFAGLTDLLSDIGHEVLTALPRPQALALEVALLRADPADGPPDYRAVATGFLSLLNALARSSPVIVAVDDLPWLDGPTLRVLEFALRRLTSEPIGVVVCTRTPERGGVPLGLDQVLRDERIFQLPVGPMSAGNLQRMIQDRMGVSFPRRTQLLIARTSAGNPFFALEITRALLNLDSELVPGEDLPIPPSLSELVFQRIAALPTETLELLSAVSAAGECTMELLEALAGRPAAVDAIAQAEARAILSREGERIRFSHPLLAAAVWSSTPPGSRHRLHRRLADLAADPEERAKHLAAVATGPDPHVATVVAEAAGHARARGAPDAAAALYERSERLTPESPIEDKWRRSVAAAECHVESGDDARARQLLDNVVTAAPAGPLRSKALLHLGNIRSRLDDTFSAIAVLEQALSEAGADNALRSAILRRLAYLCSVSGNVAGGHHHARKAIGLLEGSTDTGARSEALAHLLMTEFLLGRGCSAELMEEALALEETAAYVPVESRPSLIQSLILLWTDEPDRARTVLQSLRRRLREEGDESALPYTSWVLALVELTSGDLNAAAQHVQEGVEVAEAMHQTSLQGLLDAVTAEIHVWRGDIEPARTAAKSGLARSMRTGLGSGVVFNTTAFGFLELSLGDALAAHRCLGPLADLHMPFGAGEPSVLRFLPDEIEAVVALGDLDRAAAILEPFETRAQVLGRKWAVAAAARCRALLGAAQGDNDAALAAVEAALEMHRHFDNPLERARTLLIKGRLHRRRKEKRAARESLRQALDIFEPRGAELWAENTRRELARLGGRTAAPAELTPTEQRVAELAAAGLTNREVADAAFLTPKSVEGVLARVYRKLSIGSRAELGATMAARRTPVDPHRDAEQ